jgi:hypothetical protein
MAGRGEAACRRLERTDAGEVCGLANGSPAVAAESGRRHARRDRCRFAAAGSARGTFQIPGITRAAVEQVLGLIGHQELGAVGGAEDDGASREQAVDQDGVRIRNEAAMDGAAGFAAIPGDSDRGFDGDRQAGERTGAEARDLRPHAVGVEVDQGVELRIEPPDLCDVLVEEFASCSVAGRRVTGMGGIVAIIISQSAD